jgi:hypothetical protein
MKVSFKLKLAYFKWILLYLINPNNINIGRTPENLRKNIEYIINKYGTLSKIIFKSQ